MRASVFRSTNWLIGTVMVALVAIGAQLLVIANYATLNSQFNAAQLARPESGFSGPGFHQQLTPSDVLAAIERQQPDIAITFQPNVTEILTIAVLIAVPLLLVLGALQARPLLIVGTVLSGLAALGMFSNYTMNLEHTYLPWELLFGGTLALVAIPLMQRVGFYKRQSIPDSPPDSPKVPSHQTSDRMRSGATHPIT